MDRVGADDPEGQLAGFLAKFTPDIAARARLIIAAMRARLPTARVLVYDNYNALAVGFAHGERLKDVVFSVAVFPRWVSLFLVGGQALDDPHGLLKGSGGTVRHIVLAGAEMLDDPRVRNLMDQTLTRAATPIGLEGAGGVVIRSVSAKQRPRRPG